MLLAACSQANSIDGKYRRINQLPFEQQHGMSKALIVSDKGQKMSIVNDWATIPLDVHKEGDSFLVVQDGEPAYKITFNGDVANMDDLGSVVEGMDGITSYQFKKEAAK